MEEFSYGNLAGILHTDRNFRCRVMLKFDNLYDNNNSVFVLISFRNRCMHVLPLNDLQNAEILRENDTTLLLTGRWKHNAEPVLVKVYRSVTAATTESLVVDCAYRQTLVHPAAAPIIDYGYIPSIGTFCVFRHDPGSSLADLPPRQLQEVSFFLSVVSSVLQGLAFLHSHAVLHGNLTTSSIRVLRDGTVLFTDMAIGVLTRRTVAELAGYGEAPVPEAIREAIPDARMDLYALGVALYEALTGTVLFEGNTYDVMRGHLYREIPPIQHVLPRFPDTLATFLHTLLAKDRSMRFHSAAEALQYLASHALLPSSSASSPREVELLRAARPVGRDSLRSGIKSLLYDRSPAGIIEVSGEHGLGKTLFLHSVGSEAALVGQDVRYISPMSPDSNAVLGRIEGIASDEWTTFMDTLLEDAASKDILALFDDTDDCDDRQKNAIRSLIERAGEQSRSLKIILAHRSQLPQIGKRSDVQTLPNLMPTHMQAVCREILGQCECSEQFYRDLYAGTSGHPLYIEEVLRFLVRSGVLVRAHEVWRDVASLPALPPLASLLAEGIEQLSDDARAVLELLAVAGVPLSTGVLISALHSDAVRLLPVMYGLIQAGYATSQQGLYSLSTRQYTDVVLRILPGDRVRKYKQRLAEALLLLPGASMQLHAVDLLVESGEFERVLHLLVDLVGSDTTRAEVHVQERAARTLYAVAHQHGYRDAQLLACRVLADLYNASGDVEKERTALAEWCHLLRDTADRDRLASVMIALAQAEFACGDFAAAYTHAAEVYRMYAEQGQNSEALEARVISAQSLLQLRRWNEFVAEAGEVVAALIEAGNDRKAASLALDTGYVFAKYLQASEEAIAYYSTAQQLYGQMDDVRGMARSLGNKGIVYLEHQQYNEALACFSEAAALFKSIGDARGKLTALENIIQLHLLKQDYQLANEIARRALDIARMQQVQDEIDRIEKVLLHIQSKLQPAAGTTEVIAGQKQHAASDTSAEYLAGRSAIVRRTRELVGVAAGNDSPVLIEAPFGTGKEFVARRIHAASSRAGNSLCVLHTAGSISEELDQQVFGIGVPAEREAEAVCLLAECNNGVLYIDDVANLPAQFQAKLASFLEHGEIPVRAAAGKRWNVRIIAGCSLPADQAVAAGRLLHELFFQLSINRILLPTLAERREDIPVLVDFLIEKYNRKLGRHVEKAAPRLLQKLMQRQWTGDIRELENIIHRLMIRESSDTLQADPVLFDSPSIPIHQPAALADAPAHGSMITIDDMQKEHILRILAQTKNNKSKAARLLGIKRTTLLARMKKLGLMP